MLTNKIITRSRDLASSVHYAGLTLTGCPGSAISILNKKVRPLAVQETTDAEIGGGSSNAVVESSLKAMSVMVDADGTESHSVELGAIASFVADRVSASIKYARNTINPLVADILGKAETARGEASIGGILSRPIVMVEVPEIYYDGMLDSLIERNKTMPSTAKPVNQMLAEELLSAITDVEFLDAVRTNNEVFDKKVKSILNNVSIDHYLICDRVSRVAKSSPFNDNLSVLALLYLLAVKNGNVQSIDTNALSAEDKLEISNAINYYGFMVNRQIDDFDMYLRKNFLVDLNSTDYSSVKVVGPVYRNWLETLNGTPEAVLAFAAENNNSGMLATLQADLYGNPGKYTASYNRAVQTLAIENRLRGNHAIDKVVKQELYKFIREEYADSETEKRELLERVETVTGRAKYVSAMDLDMHILRTVCSVLCMEKNDAFEILTTMRSYLKDNPESTPATAALVSATKLVSKWVVSQMSLS
jgi:hypothetical protein